MYQREYNFLRLAKEGEKTWSDVVDRFISELIIRGTKIPKEDLDWALGNFYFLPNSPALLSAGGSEFFASACSSVPVFDTMDGHVFSILDMLKLNAMLTKKGIGTGVNFSRLRSKEEPVGGRIGTTGGPVSFLRGMSGFTSEVTQATRKSAAMGTLSVHHPDIKDWITCKTKDGEIAGFNLSVLLTDDFMNAVENDTEYELKYPKTGQTKKIKAKEIFDMIALNTWNNGEPGCIFTGNISNDYYKKLDECHILNNPCQEFIGTYDDTPGEEILEMCVLGSLNLVKYCELNKKDRRRVVNIMVRVLNNIIDVQSYVSPLQERGMKYYSRKIGVGICGLATVLAKEGIKYSSDEAAAHTHAILIEIGSFALETSEELYKENLDENGLLWVRGNKIQEVAIPKSSPLYQLKRHNVSLLSNAPTSTIGNIFNDMNEEGASYGCEPYFTIDPYIVNNSYGKWEKKEKIVDYLGTERAKEIIECANDLDWKSHIAIVEAIMDSNWGLGINQSVSKTVNFKNNITVDEVKEAIIYCWKHKIKGISFYRDGSRKNQVIQTAESYKDCVELDAKGRPIDLFMHQSPKRPEYLDCEIHHLQSESKKWLVCVGLFKGKPYEVFAGDEESISIPKKYKTGKIKKNGGYHLIVGEGDDELVIKDIPTAFKNPQYASLTRIISFSLRHGGPLRFLVEQLLKEGGFDAFNKAVARVLKKHINDNEDCKLKCPSCGGDMKYVQGCPTCLGSNDKAGCGYSKCG